MRGRRTAPVCVVGGGFAGLNAALGLAERGMRDVVQLARSVSPEDLLCMIDAIFGARDQMLEFNVPVQLALESMMVALRLPGGER